MSLILSGAATSEDPPWHHGRAGAGPWWNPAGPDSADGQPGGRWDGAEPPTLERGLFHLLQEYARHVGHLDVVRELLDGEVGE